jgi:hypothetical protein
MLSPFSVIPSKKAPKLSFSETCFIRKGRDLRLLGNHLEEQFPPNYHWFLINAIPLGGLNRGEMVPDDNVREPELLNNGWKSPRFNGNAFPLSS